MKGPKLKVLPGMNCDRGCGACCGYAPATTTEFNRIVRFARDKGIRPIEQGMACPFYQNGECAVYAVRPLSCQIYGHVEHMPCKHGYNINVDERQVRRMTRSNGLCTKLVHHAIEEMGVGKIVIPQVIEAMLLEATTRGA